MKRTNLSRVLFAPIVALGLSVMVWLVFMPRQAQAAGPSNNIQLVAGVTSTNIITVGNTFVATGNGAILGIGIITSALQASTVITIDTGSSGGPDLGDITLLAPLYIDGIGLNKTLVFSAAHDILISSFIQDNSAGGDSINLVLKADNDGDNNGAIVITGPVINTEGGNITMSGHGNSVHPQGIFIDGVIINGGGGNMVLTGTGHSTSADNLHGIEINNGGQLRTNPTGSIVMTGTAGNGNNRNAGIYIAGTSSLVRTAVGNITLTGQGNGSIDNNSGVWIDNSAMVETISTGAIVISGTGSLTAANADNHGVYVNDSGWVKMSGSNTIDIIGYGGAGGGDNNGIKVDTLGQISTINGTLTLSGTGSSIGTGSHRGVDLRGDMAVSSDSGDIIIDGTATDAFNYNQDGIFIQGLFSTDHTPISSVNGNIYLNGKTAQVGVIGSNDVEVSANVKTMGNGNIVIRALGQGDIASDIGGNATSQIIAATGSVTLTGNVLVGQNDAASHFHLKADSAISVSGYITTNSGNLVITSTNGFVRISGAYTATNYSIDTNGGGITITHAGNGVTPFIVGDAAVNGTLGSLQTNVTTIPTVNSYLASYTQSNISIITNAPMNCYATHNDGTTVFSSTNAQAVRDAVGAAAVTGDTVKIAGYCAGVSGNEVVNLTKVLTMQGGYTTTDWTTSDLGANPTILDALGGGRVVVANAFVTLSDLKVQNGNWMVAGNGGGIYAGQPITLSNITIYSNVVTGSGWGGGMYGGQVNVISTTFISNSAGVGGGLFTQGIANVITSTFMSNIATGGSGGGGAFFSTAQVMITSSTFTGNKTTVGGGGGAVFNSPAKVTNTTFNSNIAQLFGGGAEFGNTTEVISSTISNNRATTDGGGASFAGTTQITASRFINNQAMNSGGGAYFSGANAKKLVNILFNRNSATASGAAIRVNNASPLEIIHTTIVSPTMPSGAPHAIFVNNGTVYITNSIIVNHQTAIQSMVSTVSENYNLFYGNGNHHFGTVTSGGNSITDTAAFYNTTAYTLTAASAAIDKGFNLNIATDFEGQTRPYNAGVPDMGYDESPYSLPYNCYAKINNGTVFSSTDASAVQQAVDVAAVNDTVKVAGTCAGVQNRAGTNQTVYVSQTVTIQGGYTTTNWAASNLGMNPTVLDALGMGRVVYVTQPATMQDIKVQNGKWTIINQRGGGIYAGAAFTLSNVTVYSNATTGGGNAFGGGLYVAIGHPLIMANSTFISNTAERGGGLFAENIATLTAITFTNNLGSLGGGGAQIQNVATVVDSNFTNNTTTASNGHGGGLYTTLAVALTNTVFAGNTAVGASADGGGAIFSAAATLYNITFSNNTAGREGGAAYFNGTANVTATTFMSNMANTNGGGALFNATASITGTTFSNNTATSLGGGANFWSTAYVTNTKFIRNSANNGGGARLSTGASAAGKLVNVLFASNSANMGEAVYVNGINPFELVHTTIVSSSMANNSAVVVSGGTTYITNSIMASHQTGFQLFSGTVVDDYNLYDTVPMIGVTPGTHSLTGSAAFQSIAGDDYHLTASSSAIDKGTNLNITTDFEGDVRPYNANVPDMGYDESPHTALPDIAIVKTVNPISLVAGNSVTYTIAFSNVGLGVGNNVYITDVIPFTLTSVTYTTDIPAVTSSMAVSGLTYTWSIPTLGVGQGGVITITAQVPVTASAGLIANTVQVTATGETPVGNNSATANLFVVLGSCYATADNGVTVYTSSDATAVQSAVGAASVGGTVKIAGTCAGVQYNGLTTQTVYITRNVTLQGGFLPTDWTTASMANVTTLDAQGGGRVIYAVGSTVNVYGLKITNGVAGVGSDGGGIYAPSSNVTLSGTLVISNVAGSSGGGIASSFTVISLYSDFFSNTAQNVGSNGGAIYASAIITGGRFQNNWAYYHGGAIDGSFIVVSGTQFFNNTANLGYGGAIAGTVGTIQITNGYFEQNNAAAQGGAIASFGDLTAVGTQFVRNTTTSQNGGAIYVAGQLGLTNTVMTGNVADLSGGGIYSLGSGRLVNVLLAGNSANKNDGAGIYYAGTVLNVLHTTIVSPMMSSKQGIYVASGTVNITNSIIFNHATGLQQAGTAIVNENYNLLFNNTTNRMGVATGANSLTGNPAFFNTTNYTLTAASVAIDAGMNLGITTDFEGQVRPQGGGYDLGYDESIFSNSPDVRIVKTVTPASAMPGDTITYTLSYSNAGSGLANSVRITDIIPSGIVLPMTVNTPAGVGPIAGFNYVWTTPPLAGGQGGVITLRGQVAASAVAGPLVNTAQITGTGDLTPTNNISVVTLTVLPLQTNLTVSKVVTPISVVADDIVTYTLSFMNQGPKVASNVILADDLPTEVTVLSVSMTGTTLTQNVNGNRYVWQTPSLPVGASGLITITAQISSGVATNTTIANGVTITATEMDTNMADNVALAVVTVGNPQADVMLTKTVTPLVVAPGEVVTYTLEVSNNGPDTATAVLLNDPMPLELGNLAWQASGITLTLNPGGLYSWRMPSMPAGTQGVVTVTGVVDSSLANGAWLTNTATISTATPETDMTNNESTAIVTVKGLPLVGFGVASYGVDEAAGVAVITVTLSEPRPTDITVDYGAVDNTAFEGLDYGMVTGTLIFTAGEIEQSFTIPIWDDLVAEAAEVVDLNLSNAVGAVLDVANATLTIMDDDVAGVMIAPTAVMVTEGGAGATYQVRLTSEPSSAVTVTVTSLNGQVSLIPLALIFTSANWNISQTVTVKAIDDALVEGVHADIIRHGVVSNNPVYAAITPPAVNVTINDNDVPTVVFAQSSYQVAENGGQAIITVRLSATPWVTATVDYATADGTATAGLDYTATQGRLIFSPGITQVNWTVAIIEDAVLESSETINMMLSNPTNSTLANPALAQLTILDNEMAGTLTLTHNGATALGEVTTFTATLAGGSGVYSYSWDFGDGVVITTGTQNFVSYEYLAAGSYNVTVTATNGLETITDTLTIVITALPLSDLLSVKQDILMPVPLHQGEFMTYRLTILNVGNITANNVYITHTWPLGADNQPAFYGFALNQSLPLSVLQVGNQTAAPCQLQQAQLLCQVAALPVGSRATINLMLSPRLTGTLLSKVEAMAAEVDPNLSNNSVQTQTLVIAPVTPLVRQHPISHQIYLPVLMKK